MLVLTIRTDKPDSEIGLYDAEKQLDYIIWQAHRQLAETINLKIKELLDGQSKSLEDLAGIVAFQGPGSFTGLRIGLAVANALADGLEIPIVGEQGENWIRDGLTRLAKGGDNKIAQPRYGASVRITQQKK